jgi:hypothetical protein
MLWKTGQLLLAGWTSPLDKRHRINSFPITLIQLHSPSIPPPVRTRARARMLGGSHPLGAPALLNARQAVNSPRASGLDARFAWRASPLFRRSALYACPLKIHPPSSALALDQRRKALRLRFADANLALPVGFRWTLHVFFFGRAPAYAVSDDGSSAQPCPRRRGQRLCQR